MIVLLNNQVFHIFELKIKQMTEESFLTLKLNQRFNFHLEVINTVKKSQTIPFHLANFNSGNYNFFRQKWHFKGISNSLSVMLH